MKQFLAPAIFATALGMTIIAPVEAASAPTSASVRPVQDDRLVLPSPKAGRTRPLVVVVGDAGGAEITDFIVPYGVLKESGLAEVRALSTRPGPLQLKSAVRIQPDQTLAAFDASSPEGADIVIVPAQVKPDSPELIAWIQGQAAQGATIVSICEGARVLASAGLLVGKRVTTHWGAIKSLEKSNPEATWVRDRRYVQDGQIISTTGVAASLPVSMALVEAMGGKAVATSVAAGLGMTDWGASHRTADYRVTGGDYLSAAMKLLAVWTHETVEAPIEDGTDEIALALRSDVWGRSFRSKVVTTRERLAPITSKRGLVILPDTKPGSGSGARYVLPAANTPAADQLTASLKAMSRRYGPSSARLAMLGLEADAVNPR